MPPLDELAGLPVDDEPPVDVPEADELAGVPAPVPPEVVPPLPAAVACVWTGVEEQPTTPAYPAAASAAIPDLKDLRVSMAVDERRFAWPRRG